MSSGNPLSGDPECLKFVSLMIKQCAEDDFGFTKQQIRKIHSTPRGADLWRNITEDCVVGGKFDFSSFARKLCNREFEQVRACFKSSPKGADPREVCRLEVFDLCKLIEYTWTDLASRS